MIHVTDITGATAKSLHDTDITGATAMSPISTISPTCDFISMLIWKPCLEWFCGGGEIPTKCKGSSGSIIPYFARACLNVISPHGRPRHWYGQLSPTQINIECTSACWEKVRIEMFNTAFSIIWKLTFFVF